MSDGLTIDLYQTMDQFQDFEKYMTGVNPYGMKSGIVLIDPPKEWYAAAPCHQLHHEALLLTIIATQESCTQTIR